MEIPLLTDIEIILGLSIGILFAFLRMKMPALIGFFLTGLLAGPRGLGLVQAVHEVVVMGHPERVIDLEDLLEKGPETQAA